MNTYAATTPRLRVREHTKTGGQWFMDRVWRSCLNFVRRSNAWPKPILGGYAWQHRPPMPEDSQQH